MTTPIVRFEAIRPKNLDIKEMRLALVAEMNRVALDIIREYNKTASYWKRNKPKFERTLETNVGGGKETIAINIYTDNVVYKSIDRGTTSRVVDTHNVAIPMTETFRSGSIPGTLSTNSAGSRYEGAIKFVKGVFFWPGIKARLFTEQIQEKVESSTEFHLTERLQSAFERARDRWWK